MEAIIKNQMEISASQKVESQNNAQTLQWEKAELSTKS